MSLKVYIQIAMPKRQPDMKDALFACYDANSPIPWEKKIFVISDNKNRSWFCHEFNHPISEAQNLALALRKEYPEIIVRTNPIIINLVIVRANDLDEARGLLSEIITSEY